MKGTFTTNYTFAPLAVFIVLTIGICCHGKNNRIGYGNRRRDWKLSAAQLQSSAEKESGGPSTTWKAMGAMAQQTWGKLKDLLSQQQQHNNNYNNKRASFSSQGIESLSVSDDEMLGVSLQFYRD